MQCAGKLKASCGRYFGVGEKRASRRGWWRRCIDTFTFRKEIIIGGGGCRCLAQAPPSSKLDEHLRTDVSTAREETNGHRPKGDVRRQNATHFAYGKINTAARLLSLRPRCLNEVPYFRELPTAFVTSLFDLTTKGWLLGVCHSERRYPFCQKNVLVLIWRCGNALLLTMATCWVQRKISKGWSGRSVNYNCICVNGAGRRV